MFLPSHHRLRKVRETMYEDPGNPFDFESFEDPLLPSIEHVEDAGWETDNSEPWPLPGLEIAQTSSRAERDILSVFSDPFDLVNAHTDRETWSSFGSTRRSMSVDIEFLPIQGLIEGRRPSDVEPFWHLPVPTLHIQHPSGTLFTMDTRRDTKFYDFTTIYWRSTRRREPTMEHTTHNKRCQSDCSILYKSNYVVRLHYPNISSPTLFQDLRLVDVTNFDESYSH